MTEFSAIAPLKIADPDTYTWVKGRVALLDPLPSPAFLTCMTEETIWGLSMDSGLGQAIAIGLLKIAASRQEETAKEFIAQIRRAAGIGTTLARILAEHLAPVLLVGKRVSDLFQEAVTVMQAKGTYTLGAPLELLHHLLSLGETQAAEAYLKLLAIVFRQPLTYNQSNRLVHHLPRAIHQFPARRRAIQIAQLARVAQIELRLAEGFMDGMTKGLEMLPAPNLEAFVSRVLELHLHSPNSANSFLSLASKQGQDHCAALQVAAALPQVKNSLDRYLSARLGRPMSVQTMAAAGAGAVGPRTLVCSDGRFLYLAEEVDHFDNQICNLTLIKSLARLEAGFFECGTFCFDLERATAHYPVITTWVASHPPLLNSIEPGEAHRFVRSFPLPCLAEDLMAIFELARVVRWMRERYPGLVRQALPLLESEMRRLSADSQKEHPLVPLYNRLVLDQPLNDPCQPASGSPLADAAAFFFDSVDLRSPVESIARSTILTYAAMETWVGKDSGSYHAFCFPFGYRPYWRFIGSAQADQAATASRIQSRLAEKGITIYRGDLQHQLVQQRGRLSTDEIKTLVLSNTPTEATATDTIDWSAIDLANILQATQVDGVIEHKSAGPAFYYAEWDHQLQDYLKAHVRVQETAVAPTTDDAFYRETLWRRRGLVAQIRRAFELLKPEALALLRQWPEGDDFDYRALIDFVIDRRLGQMPSDRLFIKRLKQERDVAVLLLVDLSRSTANPVAGGHTTVLEVAKEALVLFSQALQVVGDTYAMAGFSGTGRLSVDYFPIKAFGEPLNSAVRCRISALAPQRSTRMGAAIRHATAQMARICAKVRLILVVSDGFPNDFGYKAQYAISDTRRAIQEARAKQVQVKAITVNIGSEPGLDDLYGRVHHHVIGDVHELPNKLLRLYGTLTKSY